MLFGLIETESDRQRKKQQLDQIAETLLKPTNSEEKPARFAEAAGKTIDADEDNWRPLTGDAKRDLNPVTQKRMQEMAHYLWESNLIANRLIELPLSYLLAEGVTLKPKMPDSEDAKETLNKFWNHPINQMDIKLPKKVRELALFGEQCYPTFVNNMNGDVQLGYLDPRLIAHVIMDPANPEQPIGIVTVKDKKGKARKYRVIINGPETMFSESTRAIRETDFTDGEAFYFKINDLSNGSRGRSDLLAQADYIDGYDQFMFGELDRVQSLRAFIWDVTINGATPDQIMQRAKEIVPPAPNSVRVHNDSEKWDAVAPTLNAGDTKETAQLLRNHILGGGTLPTHWYGGGEDVNRASAAEMGEPTFKVFSMRQKMLKYMLECMGTYVLRQKILKDKNKEPDWFDESIQTEAVFAEMTSKDISKYAAALMQVITAVSQALDKKLMSEETALNVINTIAERLGIKIDAKEELNNAVKDKNKRDEDEAFTTPADNSLDLAA